MIEIVTLVLALGCLGVSGGLVVLSRRASRARRELASDIHDKAMALDHRCDVLQSKLDEQRTWQRIDHLQSLVDLSRSQGQLDVTRAQRLDGYVLALHDEARSDAKAG